MTHNFKDNARVQYPFYLAVRATAGSKSDNNVIVGDISNRSRDQGNAEQGGNFNSRKYGRSVSELLVEKRMGESSSHQPTS